MIIPCPVHSLKSVHSCTKNIVHNGRVHNESLQMKKPKVWGWEAVRHRRPSPTEKGDTMTNRNLKSLRWNDRKGGTP